MTDVASPKEKNLVLISCVLGYMMDGMNLTLLSLLLPLLITAFALSNIQAGFLGTVTLFAVGIGGISSGFLADKFGRVRTLFWIIIGFSVGTALLSIVQSYSQFVVVRTISALFLGGEWGVGAVLMSEYIQQKRRGLGSGITHSGYPLGVIAASILVTLFAHSLGWRAVFLMGLFPVIIALWIRRVVSEPKTWLAHKEKKREQNIDMGPLVRKSMKMFIYWSIAAAFLQSAFWGVSVWLPSYMVNVRGFTVAKAAAYILVLGIGNVVGSVVGGWLSDLFSRKLIYSFFSILSGVFLPITILYSTKADFLAFIFIFAVLFQVPCGLGDVFLSESFPTELRGTGVGVCYNVGRFIAGFAPLIIGAIAMKGSLGSALASMGGLWVLLGVWVAIFIPEKLYDSSSVSDALPKSA